MISKKSKIVSKYLLDTSICSYLMKDDSIVREHLDALADSDDYFTIPIVYGEILYGIERWDSGRRKADLSQKANQLFNDIRCEFIPKEASKHYAQLKRKAEEQGQTLAENDLWIAATALALDAIVVSSDTDFERVENLLGLQVENWVPEHNS